MTEEATKIKNSQNLKIFISKSEITCDIFEDKINNFYRLCKIKLIDGSYIKNNCTCKKHGVEGKCKHFVAVWL